MHITINQPTDEKVFTIEGGELLSIPETAFLLNMSEQTIRNMINAKSIPHFRIGGTEKRKAIIRVPKKLLAKHLSTNFYPDTTEEIQ